MRNSLIGRASLQIGASLEKFDQFPELTYLRVSTKSLDSTKQLWRSIEAATAHIQPKAVFNTIKTTEQNRECCGIQ